MSGSIWVKLRENETALGQKQSKKALQDKMRTLGEAHEMVTNKNIDQRVSRGI